MELLSSPPYVARHLQLLGTGIIQNRKHHFKGLLVRLLLTRTERKDDLQISLIDALHFGAVSWDQVMEYTNDTRHNWLIKTQEVCP